MRNKLLPILVLSILVASTLVGCGSSLSTLTVLSVAEGHVSVMKAGTDSWTEAEVGMRLEIGDSIKTGDDSSAEITFFDGSIVELEAGTEIEIASLDISTDTSSTTIILKQTIGSIIFRVIKIVDPASRYEVETPTAVVAVRGSAVQVYVIEDGTTSVTNLEGDIWAIAQGVELQIPQGQQCIIRPDRPPELIFMVTAGGHTVGLRSDGTVLAVGRNDDGQCDVGAWTDLVQVAAGGTHTVGLKNDGTVVAVGDNSMEQCDVGDWTDITQVAAGAAHTVGLRYDGTAVAVGYDYYGQCEGVGTWTDITQVAAGGHKSVGLKSDGTVVAVGYNGSGQCDVGTWTGIILVAAGGTHTVGLKADSSVVAVGWNEYGQCDVGTWTGITQVATGEWHTLGVEGDGTMVAVGLKSHGQCDVNDWTEIIQAAGGEWHTVGLRSDGTVLAVGRNDDGQCNVGGWDLN